MTIDLFPSTDEFLATFVEEVTVAGGRVIDAYNDADAKRLFARAVLPKPREVAAGDKVQGGVALRATDEDVRVHPYVFRQVCTNGAIMAHAVESRVIETGRPFEVLANVREAIRLCCGDAPFAKAATQMRAARDADTDLLLNLMPMLSRLPRETASRILQQVMGHVRQEPDRARSAFGVMQAITATARDTRDPETRWRLEELGGGVLARLRPRRPADEAPSAVVAQCVEENDAAAVLTS